MDGWLQHPWIYRYNAPNQQPTKPANSNQPFFFFFFFPFEDYLFQKRTNAHEIRHFFSFCSFCPRVNNKYVMPTNNLLPKSYTTVPVWRTLFLLLFFFVFFRTTYLLCENCGMLGATPHQMYGEFDQGAREAAAKKGTGETAWAPGACWAPRA